MAASRLSVIIACAWDGDAPTSPIHWPGRGGGVSPPWLSSALLPVEVACPRSLAAASVHSISFFRQGCGGELPIPLSFSLSLSLSPPPLHYQYSPYLSLFPPRFPIETSSAQRLGEVALCLDVAFESLNSTQEPQKIPFDSRGLHQERSCGHSQTFSRCPGELSQCRRAAIAKLSDENMPSESWVLSS